MRVFEEASAVAKRAWAGTTAQVRAAAGRWYPPGSNVPITHGDSFSGKMTFEHSGPGAIVYVGFRLDVDAPSPGKWEWAISSWVTIPNDASWKSYTIETDLGTFEWAGGVRQGWHIAGDMMLKDDKGNVLLQLMEMTNLYLTVSVAAEWRKPSAMVSSSRAP